MNNDKYKKLIGVKVVGLQKQFDSGDDSITFLTENGSFRLFCDGDCCSRSWFEHIELPEFPFTITKFEEVAGKDLTNDPVLGREYQEGEHATYAIKIETDKGYGDIDMRNDSDGYYGGWFVLNTNDL